MILLQDDTIWTWSHFLFGLTYAITASLLFLFIVLFLFKPKIKIAPFLCKNTNPTEYYAFKFVNFSFFSAHDIRAELHQMRRIPMGGGKFNNEYKKLALLNNEISHIPRRLPFWNKNDANPHCITVRSVENINEILKVESNAVLFRVSLRHGLTGLSKVFEQEFGNEQDIRIGKFKPGTKFATL
jgi:hypothetical protein